MSTVMRDGIPEKVVDWVCATCTLWTWLGEVCRGDMCVCWLGWDDGIGSLCARDNLGLGLCFEVNRRTGIMLERSTPGAEDRLDGRS